MYQPTIYFLNPQTLPAINAAIGYDITEELDIPLDENNIIPFICIFAERGYYTCYASYTEYSEIRYFANVVNKQIEGENLKWIFSAIDKEMTDGENLAAIRSAKFEIPTKKDHSTKLFASIHLEGTYTAGCTQVAWTQFTEKNGYNSGDIFQILRLDVGEQWTAAVSIADINHLIIRIK